MNKSIADKVNSTEILSKTKKISDLLIESGADFHVGVLSLATVAGAAIGSYAHYGGDSSLAEKVFMEQFNFMRNGPLQ